MMVNVIYITEALKLAQQALWQKPSMIGSKQGAFLSDGSKAYIKDRNTKDCWVWNAPKVIRMFFLK